MLRFMFLLCAAVLCPATIVAAGGDAVVQDHSYARPGEAVMTHLELDLTVDFGTEVVRGRATIHIDNKTGTDRLYLDTRNLEIAAVTTGSEGTPAVFELGDDGGYLGRALSVVIMPNTKVVNVDYATTEGAIAIDWLKPAQTAGGRHPFLFTQGQAILTRTWIPCQDTPGVRFTYSATVRVPAGLMAVMSASNGTERAADGVYRFNMPQAVPAYLVALAVGDIEFRTIGSRTGVYAEPSVVEAAAWEFADTEDMMRAAEALYGPYRWGRFDMIVLPPSFPFGGMENPRLTFLTPVLVAGDRSLVSTIAHELAHSWSGNLVTNASWNDFWLNEGFTVYFERRILEAIYGRDRSEMEGVLAWADLEEAIAEFGSDNPDTRLRIESGARDPDEALASGVQYEKGYLFLRMIEESVGREAWDGFLRGYFDRFAFESMTTDRFVDYLRSELLSKYHGLDEKLNIEEWIDAPGLPEQRPVARSDAFGRVEREITRWVQGEPAGGLATSGWNSLQWKHFVQHLPREMTRDQMAALDDAFHFTDKANAEVTQQWLLRAIDNHYSKAYSRLDEYLVTIGRIWLIRPLYARLVQSEAGRAMAEHIYAKARPGYHPLTVGIVDRVLADEGQGSE